MLEKIKSPEDAKKLNSSQLRILIQEIRDKIINTISVNGGHLASNLGIVELAVALHYVYDTPRDKIIWDVGHQCYPHKILTGRFEKFDTIRKTNGLSGFPKKEESEHDCFTTGHASTAISSALGIAKARDIKGENFNVVAVIGDGALTGGLAYEGLNNLGYLQTDMLVILNDNKMSISENIGALAKEATRVKNTDTFKQVRADYYELLEKVSDELKPRLEGMKSHLKALLTPGLVFEKLGINYTGPIDGHDVNALIETLKQLKDKKGPKLLHIYTTKGKGYAPAENDSAKFHGTSAFDIETGEKILPTKSTFTDVFSDKLLELAKQNPKIIGITAAMDKGTGLYQLKQDLPGQFFDVGIAEAHAVTFAAGLASQGMIPVVAIYSTFLQRAYDQVIHDVCLQNLHVVFAIDRAGLVGEDGPTHQGVFDLSYLIHIPNLVIMAPSNCDELRSMLELAIKHQGPVAIRYSKDCCTECKNAKVELGIGELTMTGKKTLVIAIGSTVGTAKEACKETNSTLINARFAKPLDERLIIEQAKKHDKIITIEENTTIGGFGSQINQLLSFKKVINLGVNDAFIEQGSTDEQRKNCGLTKQELVRIINS